MAESKCNEGRKRRKSDTNDELLHANRGFVVEGLQSSSLSDSTTGDSSDEDVLGEQPPSRKRVHSDSSDEDVLGEQPPSRKRFHSDSSSHDDAGDYHNMAKKLVQYAPETVFEENKAQKMMAKMGYKTGHGLGKHEQGRVAPVEMSRQRGRRGLGLHLPGLEPANLVWNSNMEHISCEEEVVWFEHDPYIDLSYNELCSLLVIGHKKLTIDDETNFCDPDVLKNVLSGKSVFDNLDGNELRKARTRSNPFETIRGGIFLNRAAMKMANMDAVFGKMFTNPVDELGHKLVEPEELLYFADVCAGPGGFSEYVLWRCGWEAKGFGFTLKGDNDFKLTDFYAGNCETFEPHYGVGGADGDGDIFKSKNIDAFREHVLLQTEGRGVHFMMADGGFSVEGQENIQEILSKELYLCQFIVALCIVREKGHFVCKLFDVFTPFSVGLVYLMSKAFKKISIHKPNTSRPANSERYIICKWRRPCFQLEPIKNYLRYVHDKLKECQKQGDKDVVEVVPLSLLMEEGTFFDYIVTSNNVLGERQIINLVKIASFCRDPNLTEPLQAEMKQKCLQYWEVPDKARTAPPRVKPDVKVEELLRKSRTSGDILTGHEQLLTGENLRDVLRSVYDWHCMVLGTPDDDRHRTLYLGMGRGKVFRLEGSHWRKVDDPVELSPDTLVYAEMMLELLGEGRSQRKVACLHLLDALVLGGTDVSSRHLSERHIMCRKFCRALEKPLRSPATLVHTKELFDLEVVDQLFDRLAARQVKGQGTVPRRVFLMDEDTNRCYVPGGVMFLRATRPPWMRFLSKSTNMTYYNNPTNGESLFDKERPDDACERFEQSVKHRCVWWWGKGVHVYETDGHEEDLSKLQRWKLVEFVNGMCKPARQEQGTAPGVPECAICLQTCVHPARLPCSHVFCFLCVKGVANQSKKCAMCRQEIPSDYLERPQLLEQAAANKETPGFDDGHQWFYEGRNGWWQYDERTSRELESAYKHGERHCELLIAGFLYVADFDAMLQLRRNDPSRRRRIKRDLASIPKKGIAGLRLAGEAPPKTTALPAALTTTDTQEDEADLADHLQYLTLHDDDIGNDDEDLPLPLASWMLPVSSSSDEDQF